MDPNGVLMDLATVAASNIARALELAEDQVPHIRQAIKDEIDAMSTHFALALGDIQSTYQAELAQLRADKAALIP